MSEVVSIIAPMRPSDRQKWRHVATLPGVDRMYPVEIWDHTDGFCALSAVEVVSDAPGLPSKGPEYHLSFSVCHGPQDGPHRTTAADAAWILDQFGADGFEEDNHVPGGVVRNFWRPVADPLVGLECACKDTEPAIVEDKGDFVWRAVP